MYQKKSSMVHGQLLDFIPSFAQLTARRSLFRCKKQGRFSVQSTADFYECTSKHDYEEVVNVVNKL